MARFRWVNLDGGVHEIPLPDARGRLWLCGKHAMGPGPELVLRRIGVDDAHVVCLVQRHEIADRYPLYVRWLEENHDRTWTPIADLSALPFDEALLLYRSVALMVASGRNVVAHCAAGMGRAGTLAVAVSMIHGVPVDRALSEVRAARPGAGPEVGAQRESINDLARWLADPTTNRSTAGAC